MKHLCVLIAEDSIYDADLSVREIRRAGFTVEYTRVDNQKSMEIAMYRSKWDLIISEHSMHNFDAFRAIEIRNKVDINIPFIITYECETDKEILNCIKRGCDGIVSKERMLELNDIVKLLLG